MANEDTRPETQEPEVRDVPSADAKADPVQGPVAAPDTVTPGAAKDAAHPTSASPAPERADPPVAPRQRSVVLPMLLGGAICAVIGFGLAKAVPGGWPVQDVSPLQAEIQRQAQEITALRDRVASLSTPNLAPLEQRISVLENPEVPAADLQAQIEQLRTQIGNGTISPDLQAAIDRTEEELAAARSQAEDLRRQAEDAARGTTVAAALSRIAGALDSGTPFGAALDDLQTAGVQVPQPLTDAAGGVPSITDLRQDFPDAARAALDASLRADAGAGWAARAGAFLRSQTGARSLTPREGNDPDAILSRAEAALAQGDLKGALREVGTLPLEGQAAMSEWRAETERRIAAQDALAQMNAGSN